jgi:ribonuclease P protein subunit RPR2
MLGFLQFMSGSNKAKAKEHVDELFAEAASVFDNDPQLSKRYVVIARKIAMKHKISFDREKKLSFCKECNAYLKKGFNSTIRIHDNRMVLTCKECGFVRRFVLK